MTARLAVTPGIALLVWAMSARAQEASLSLGGTHARYADSLSGSAGVTALRLRVLGRLHAAELQGVLSRFASGEWAAQTSGQAASFVALSDRIAAGITGGATGGTYQGGTWSGMAAAGPLVVITTGRTLLSAGASGGWVRSVDQVSRTTGTGILRVRHRAASDVVFDGGMVGTIATDAIRYADVTGGVTFERSTVLLAATAGVRAGDLADGPWGQARLEYAPVPYTRIEASVGRYPRDLSGFSDGVFVQAGLRLAVGRASPRRPAAVPPVRALRQNAQVTRVIVRYHRPVSELAIAGAFCDWQPVRLRRGDGEEWSTELPLDVGVHQYALIADGEWTLPDGVERVDDGLGGYVGILVVKP